MDIHDWIMDIHNCIHNSIVDTIMVIHNSLLSWIMCFHGLIMGIHNSIMDIPLEGLSALGFSYQYAFIASQRIHGANNIIM